MLAKDMHQILQIEFKNCIFSASERELPLRLPLFKFLNIYKSFDKGIKKQEKWEDLQT